MKLSTEPLICNQIEIHPFLDQSAAVAVSRAHGMTVVAYSPVAKGAVGKNAVLARIGKAHGKTAAQVGLRFLLQQDIVVIPRTSKVERLSENFAIFDFALSPQEMAEIRKLARPSGSVMSHDRWDLTLMFFTLSKVLGFLALPSNLMMLIGLIGAALLLTRRKRLGQGMMIASLLTLAVAGWSPLGNWLMAPLENRFPAGEVQARRTPPSASSFLAARFRRRCRARAAPSHSMKPPSA